MQPHLADVAILNKRLEGYGKMLDGRPVFRIVWADNLTEKRAGLFNEFYGQIFIRQSTGVQEVRKYGYLSSCWVLEKYSAVPNHEVLNYDNYEPVYAFRDKDGNYLPPIWPVCEIIIDGIINPKRLTPEQELDLLEKAQQKRIEQDVMMLEEKRPNFMVLKGLGELVTKPSKEFKRKRPSYTSQKVKN